MNTFSSNLFATCLCLHKSTNENLQKLFRKSISKTQKQYLPEIKQQYQTFLSIRRPTSSVLCNKKYAHFVDSTYICTYIHKNIFSILPTNEDRQLKK